MGDDHRNVVRLRLLHVGMLGDSLEYLADEKDRDLAGGSFKGLTKLSDTAVRQRGGAT